jgi:SET domain-containing protein
MIDICSLDEKKRKKVIKFYGYMKHKIMGKCKNVNDLVKTGIYYELKHDFDDKYDLFP